MEWYWWILSGIFAWWGSGMLFSTLQWIWHFGFADADEWCMLAVFSALIGPFFPTLLALDEFYVSKQHNSELPGLLHRLMYPK